MTGVPYLPAVLLSPRRLRLRWHWWVAEVGHDLGLRRRIGSFIRARNCKSTNVTSLSTCTYKELCSRELRRHLRSGTLPHWWLRASSCMPHGATGNGSAPISLLSSPVTTDATGGFTIATTGLCPYSDSVLYLVARGGSAGSTGTSSNAAE